MGNIIIKTENSAPSQNIPSKSSKWIANKFEELEIKNLLDFGCGRLRNEQIFCQYDCAISVIDIEAQIKRLPKESLSKFNVYTYEHDELPINEFDVVTLILVLHIIPDVATRKEVLKRAYSAVKPGGYLLIDVPTGERYYRQMCTEENKYNDGFILSHGSSKTFYKNYLAKELDNFINETICVEKVATPYFDKHICRLFIKGKK